jgi:type III restriction enzyme
VPPVSIENPILNSPFAEPTRHFRFDEDGITSEIAEGRRRSTYFIPIAKAKVKGGAQLSLPGDWVGERMTDDDFINRVREQVSAAWEDSHVPIRARADAERPSAAGAGQSRRIGRGLGGPQ